MQGVGGGRATKGHWKEQMVEIRCRRKKSSFVFLAKLDLLVGLNFLVIC